MEFRKMVTITLCTRQQKRHSCIEQSYGLCGRGRGWAPELTSQAEEELAGSWEEGLEVEWSPGRTNPTERGGLEEWEAGQVKRCRVKRQKCDMRSGRWTGLFFSHSPKSKWRALEWTMVIIHSAYLLSTDTPGLFKHPGNQGWRRETKYLPSWS